MWQDKAACQEADWDLFFPVDWPGKYYSTTDDPEHERKRVRLSLMEAAKAYCRVCPVVAECLAGAIAEHDTWSIRGGMTYQERTAYRRRKPKGHWKRTVSPVVLHEPGEDSMSYYLKGCPCDGCKEHNRMKGVKRRQRERERVSA